MPTKKEIRNYMVREAENCRENHTGEINITQLAENAADYFGQWSELDDSDSLFFEIAAEFFEK